MLSNCFCKNSFLPIFLLNNVFKIHLTSVLTPQQVKVAKEKNQLDCQIINRFYQVHESYNQLMENNSTRFKEVSKVMALDTLKTVDQYIIKNKLLGSALNTNNDILACKMIEKKNLMQKITNSTNKAFTRDFLINAIRNEANAWKMLKHKNIASFKWYSQTENNVYFFIQYCSDGTLQSILKSQKFNQSDAFRIFKQIVDGCQYLYDKNILHRDLKPQNIMMHNGEIKIADFGFAKLLEDDQLKNILMQRTYVGTPFYMSPQVLLQKPYSIKCDIWSIGIILYQLLFWALPWQKVDKLEDLVQAVRTQPNFPPSMKIDPLLKQLILMMLAYHQKDRMSIKQVKQYLQSLDKI